MNNPFTFNPDVEKQELSQPVSLLEKHGDAKHRRILRTFIIKQFGELSTRELFDILELRSRVFVLEQNCAYQDVDQKDLIASHVMMMEDNRIEGYARLLPSGTTYPEPSIGRVLVEKKYRGQGSGTLLMEYCISKSRELFNKNEIVISAQLYLTRFYEQLGFTAEGETYWEDDIPHVKMRYQVRS
jgi:ElaA protein